MSAEEMLAAARKDLGLAGRPNWITKDYASRNGREFLTAPWCNQAVTEWARKSGNAAAVLPNGDRAYTVWSAEDGQKLGRWHAGTVANIKKYAKPGAPIYFDWDGTDWISAIDHIGIIERVLPDGRVQTIEANTGNAVKRRVRSASVIAGFWNPDYADTEKNWTEDAVKKLPTLKKGDKGWDVKTLHYLLLARDYGGLEGVDDTVFTDAHANGIRGIQEAAGIEVDGVCGPQTWPVLLRVA